MGIFQKEIQNSESCFDKLMQSRDNYCVKGEAFIFLFPFHCFHSILDASGVLGRISSTCLIAARLRQATHAQFCLKGLWRDLVSPLCAYSKAREGHSVQVQVQPARAGAGRRGGHEVQVRPENAGADARPLGAPSIKRSQNCKGKCSRLPFFGVTICGVFSKMIRGPQWSGVPLALSVTW